MAALSKAFQESAGDDDTEKQTAHTAETDAGNASSSENDASKDAEQD